MGVAPRASTVKVTVLPELVATFAGSSTIAGNSAKVAVIDLLRSTVMESEFEFPSASPLQFAKAQPCAAVAVAVTTVLLG